MGDETKTEGVVWQWVTRKLKDNKLRRELTTTNSLLVALTVNDHQTTIKPATSKPPTIDPLTMMQLNNSVFEPCECLVYRAQETTKTCVKIPDTTNLKKQMKC